MVKLISANSVHLGLNKTKWHSFLFVLVLKERKIWHLVFGFLDQNRKRKKYSPLVLTQNTCHLVLNETNKTLKTCSHCILKRNKWNLVLGELNQNK